MGQEENSWTGRLFLAVVTLPVVGLGYLAGHYQLVERIPFGAELKASVQRSLGLSSAVGDNVTTVQRRKPVSLGRTARHFIRQPISYRALFLFNKSGKGPRADLFQTTTFAKNRRDPVREFLAPRKYLAVAGIKVSRGRGLAKADKLKLGRLPSSDTPLRRNVALSHADSVKSPLVIAAATGLPDVPGEALSKQLDPFEAEKLSIRQAAMRPRTLRSGRVFGGLTEEEFRKRELRCMTTAIYFEARGEPVRGQLAVGQVIMNRVRSPEYPDTICGVIFQGESRKNACQFSFACDGLADRPDNPQHWRLAKSLARQITSGEVWLNDVGYSTHYHATYVAPDWRVGMQRVKQIGRHIFYIAKEAAVTETFQRLYSPGYVKPASRGKKEG